MFGPAPGRTASLTLTIAAATALDTTPAAIQEDPPDLEYPLGWEVRFDRETPTRRLSAWSPCHPASTSRPAPR